MKKERKNFVEALETQNKKRKVLTENLAVAYDTSGKELLDFNFKLVRFRNLTEKEIEKEFSKVFFEDPVVAVKYLFYVGDIRGGLGERKIFRACFDWLGYQYPALAMELLSMIPEYTRWDTLVRLINHGKLGYSAGEIIADQLANDIKGMSDKKPISLLAKWLPSENTSSKETRALACRMRSFLEMTPRAYRKTLSALRKYLDIVEVKASANDWDKINYESVPSQANLKYKNAFMKHDADRRIEYLESLKRGDAKINASVAQPHEIVQKYRGGHWWSSIKDYDETLEQMWKALPDISVADTLVVRDGSGSMNCPATGGTTSCLDVATALAIYCAEHNSKEWRDKFITFSSRPKFVNMSKCKSLRDKIELAMNEAECSNTNIAKTMQLILDTAIANGFTQEEMPMNILIISDMQFDGSYFNWGRSLFEDIALKFNEHGYKLPRIIFWNLNPRSSAGAIPMQNNELGLVLCSGFSTTNMKMFMSGEVDPYKVLLEQLNTERYEVIEKIAASIL